MESDQHIIKPPGIWANRFREECVEAGVLLLAAILLGVGYSAVHGRGLFGERRDISFDLDTMSTFITVDEARLLFDSGRALFVDARHSYDYDLGHIKGAINIPLQSFDPKSTLISSLPKDRFLVTYCDGQECNSSVALAEKLVDTGFPDIKIFLDGWNAWKSDTVRIERSVR